MFRCDGIVNRNKENFMHRPTHFYQSLLIIASLVFCSPSNAQEEKQKDKKEKKEERKEAKQNAESLPAIIWHSPAERAQRNRITGGAEKDQTLPKGHSTSTKEI